MHTDKLIRKVVVFLAFTLCLAQKMTAFETFKFSVAPKYAFQNGQLDEIVLYANGNQLSELNWQIDKMSLLGFNATVGWEMILIEANCLWGSPKSSGTMYDSDWLNTSSYGMKTNYSESSNFADSLGDLQVKIGVDIKTWDFLHIIPYLGLSYNRAEFTANGGTYWYGDMEHTGLPYHVSYDSPEAKKGSLDSEGDVITYEREMFNYQLGVKVKYEFLTRFTLSADFALAVFTQVNSVDNHIIKSIDYLDKMQGFFSCFDAAAELDVKIWKGLSAGFGFRFDYLRLIQGIDYIKKAADSKYAKASGGSSAAAKGYFYNIEAFVRYSF
jgi:outer membrane protease